MRDLTVFEIQRQPDDVSCGPTCLHAVYRYFGDELPPDIREREEKMRAQLEGK